MEYTRLGRTGLKVSQLCLGTMNFGWSADEPTSHKIMDAALDAGINFFDTADVYSRWVPGNPGGVSETMIGNWLKTKNRREIIIATKVRGRMWEGVTGEGLSRQHILHAVEDSLRRLQTDYIDLYQTHWFDAETPIDETLYALDSLVQSGKVRYLGASNYSPWRFMHALWTSDKAQLARFDTLQPHYSLFHRGEYEDDLAEICVEFGIGVLPYSPLAAGFATGKYQRQNRQNVDTTRSESGLIKKLIDNERAYDALDLLQTFAGQHQAPIAHIALAWLLAKPAITSPIIGARTVDQLLELIGATELNLSQDELHQLNDATQGF
jgi:aryl-alcohol dehydrogenase-like predicted oxidoreductase